jgi:hypothetical protein
MKDFDYKALAKELLENLYRDGMIFVIYPDGESEVTSQNAGYFPIKPLAKIDLSAWYWKSGVLGGYDLENLSEEDADYLIEYLAEEIESEVDQAA